MSALALLAWLLFVAASAVAFERRDRNLDRKDRP